MDPRRALVAGRELGVAGGQMGGRDIATHLAGEDRTHDLLDSSGGLGTGEAKLHQ